MSDTRRRHERRRHPAGRHARPISTTSRSTPLLRISSARSNIIDGVMLEDCKVEFCGRTFECVDKGFEKNAPVDVVIRPEDLKIVYAGDGLLQGVVESIVFKGVHYEMMVRTQFFTFMVHSTMAESVGKTVGLSVIPFDIHIMHKSAEAEA